MKWAKHLKNHLGIAAYRNGPKISFLMFASDCIIFAKASHNTCNNINNITQKLCIIWPTYEFP